MRSLFSQAIGVLVVVFGAAACAPAYDGSSLPKKKTTAEQPTPNAGGNPDDREDGDEDNDNDGNDRAPSEDSPPIPAAGSGGPVQQVSTKFPGSKAFLPAKLPAPGLLMLHGSEGGADGTIETDAQFYAEKGFVVVTLCWFGCAGAGAAAAPAKVHRVALDRTVEAGIWLGSTVEVGGKNVGLFGWSRGGEQAALLGSLLKTKVPFATIAVHAPSDTVVASYDPATDNSVIENGVPAPAWTFKGAPLFGEAKTTDIGTGPRIEIEKYPGALFISHGQNDQLWEVARGQRLAESRKKVSGLVTEAHFWPGVDHVIETQADQSKFDAAIIPFLSRELKL